MASSSSSPSNPLRRSARNMGGSDNSPLPLAHLVGACVDRSGSISSMGNAPPEQMCSQMAQLKDEAEKTGVATFMTIVTFDDRAETFMDNVQLDGNDELPSFTDFQKALRPRGMTRFYDTVYESLDALEHRRDEFLSGLAPMARKLNPKVVCSLLVLTDGADNTSVTHTRHSVATRMAKARANGVNAIFLAANIDASTEGAALGFAKQATVQMGASYAEASQCMRAVSAGLRQASSGAADVDYSQMASQAPANDPVAGGSSPSSLPSLPPMPPMPPMPLLRRY